MDRTFPARHDLTHFGREPGERAVNAGLDRLLASDRKPHREYAEQQLRRWDAATAGWVEAGAESA